jgi:alanyl-tRNA synthetase
MEIGNSVFMQFVKTEEGWNELSQKNVDFGGGLERLAMVVQKKTDIFETDNFWPLISEIQTISGLNYYTDEKTKSNMRIIADHVRACTLLTMDGVTPSNKDQGYVLRRLFRRMIRAGKFLGMEDGFSGKLVPVFVDMFSWMYPQLESKEAQIIEVFNNEEKKFNKTLKNGKKQLQKSVEKSNPSSSNEWAKLLFDMYQSLGFPLEISLMELVDMGYKADVEKIKEIYNKLFEEHQQGSRLGAEEKFKGGLADHSEEVIKYHTLTHLLQKALKTIIGDEVKQLGSNITGERLRFDFPHSNKLTEEEILKVEKIVNDHVDQSIPVNFVFMPTKEARESGALFMEHESYPDPVKVYFIGNTLEEAVSKEFCGGPHVGNTSQLGHIKIYKQEQIGQGKIRIYAKFS